MKDKAGLSTVGVLEEMR